MANVSIHYIIYNKERHQDGKYPIKLRFTYKRIPTIVATNLFAVEGELVAVKKGEENKSRTIKEPNLRRKVVDGNVDFPQIVFEKGATERGFQR